MKKGTIIAILFTLIIVGSFLYFVSGITSGNSVIKRYLCQSDINEFVSHVQKFSHQNHNVISKITDTTGNFNDGYTIYISVEVDNEGQKILYSVACEKVSRRTESGTVIELVMAYDKTNKIGGYNKEAKGVESLIDSFETNFLRPLSINQNIKIMPYDH